MLKFFSYLLHLAPHEGCQTQLPTGTYARGLGAR